jgi:hypothetical protein
MHQRLDQAHRRFTAAVVTIAGSSRNHSIKAAPPAGFVRSAGTIRGTVLRGITSAQEIKGGRELGTQIGGLFGWKSQATIRDLIVQDEAPAELLRKPQSDQ